MITPFEFVLLALAARGLGWYWANADVAKPIQSRVARAVERRGWPGRFANEGKPPLERMVADAVNAVQQMSEVVGGNAPEVPRKQRVFRWLHGGLNCQLCSGQWAAFLVYGLWTETQPLEWGWRGLITTVAINTVGIVAVQLSDLTVTFCPKQDAVFSIQLHRNDESTSEMA